MILVMLEVVVMLEVSVAERQWWKGKGATCSSCVVIKRYCQIPCYSPLLSKLLSLLCCVVMSFCVVSW